MLPMVLPVSVQGLKPVAIRLFSIGNFNRVLFSKPVWFQKCYAFPIKKDEPAEFTIYQVSQFTI
jgi:hypothetical protein